ncbi:winged helix-turn-helix transcriptional regulator [Pseudomonas stutzeri]|uniref:winged helix-turn-helix transcriptional regulator n=1 Tax=Stutzerimonas stutzeri TaxID=316 RepID=UPI00210A5FED|nr:winged helix-turn-helix transcriptional regulator [Stutzerimonas stutzeri]MCQ4310884.1 winged helix-turn-helix transcriptional regulator [Stutzerimonas stutzeri]
MAGRKPIHLEMKGLKSNRQRIWEVLRAEQNTTTYSDIAARADVDIGAVRSYIKALEKAGFTERLTERVTGAPLIRLVRDCGAEAPAVTKSGEPSSAGRLNETMWRSLRILGETSATELADQAAAAAGKASLGTAIQYLKWLHRAGYLLQTQAAQGGKNGSRARYRLAPGKYTGPLAPMVQRGGQLYDPNLGEVVYSQLEGAQA